MLHTKFQVSEPSGSGEDFIIFCYVFLWFKHRTPVAEPFLILRPLFEQTCWTTARQCYIPNFKHLSQAVLKKKNFNNFPIRFYGSNRELLGQGHFRT